MATKELLDLLDETRRRQRRTTDLSKFDTQIKEMMGLNISLPVILEWLEKKGNKTTLPALRRYVKRVFGDNHYAEFMKRNGWLKTKHGKPIERQLVANTEKTEPRVAATSTPPTLGEMKEASQDFDLDPTRFDD